MPFAAGKTVSFEPRDHTGYLQMERPEARNALSDQLKIDLVAALREFERDDDLRVLVLSGSDCGAFSAGGDIKRIVNEFAGDNGAPPAPVPDLFAVLTSCEKPMIAAIDGFAVGGGLEVALTCDLRVATRASSFGMPEPRIGMLGDFGLDNLCRMIPVGEALRIQLTGARITGERAYQIGLVQELADDRAAMFETATALARDILKCSPQAVRTIKQVVKRGRNLPIEYARLLSAPAHEHARYSEDAAEGTRAFAEKRQPSWAV